MFERINQSLLSNWWWKIDKLTLLIIILLIIFGGIALSSASIAVERKIDVASSFFIKKQIFYIGCAIILLFLTSLLSIEFIKSFWRYCK